MPHPRKKLGGCNCEDVYKLGSVLDILQNRRKK